MNLDKIISENTLRKVNNYYLYEKDISVLEKYQIPYHSCQTMEELLFIINDFVNSEIMIDEEIEELEQTSINISELYYYQFTNK